MNATAAQTKSLEWLNRLRANPKIPLIVAGSAAVAVMVALILWAKAPDYRTLFSNLSDQDGGAIVSQLTQMNIPYRFSEASGAIEVPADKVHELRLRLAQQGLPKGGAVGFELLDQEKFGISQFSEQVNYQRALEPSLEQQLAQLQMQAHEQGYQAGIAEGRQQGHEQGYQEGLARGLEQGLAEAKSQQAPIHARMQQLVSEFQTTLDALDSVIASRLMQMALEAARQVIGQTPTVDNSALIKQIQQLLQQEPLFSGKPQLRVHPDDLQRVDDMLGATLSLHGWRLRGDPTLHPGGCKVSADEGDLDASVATRWQELCRLAAPGVV
ncbi:flagellar assembly protein FliH [Escherichia coli]|nr:flagellar assembly protein FliH [Escherichia coli]